MDTITWLEAEVYDGFNQIRQHTSGRIDAIEQEISDICKLFSGQDGQGTLFLYTTTYKLPDMTDHALVAIKHLKNEFDGLREARRVINRHFQPLLDELQKNGGIAPEPLAAGFWHSREETPPAYIPLLLDIGGDFTTGHYADKTSPDPGWIAFVCNQSPPYTNLEIGAVLRWAVITRD